MLIIKKSITDFLAFSQYIKYRSETQDNNPENLDRVVDEQIENNSAQTKRNLIDGNLYKRYQKRFYQTVELNRINLLGKNLILKLRMVKLFCNVYVKLGKKLMTSEQLQFRLLIYI